MTAVASAKNERLMRELGIEDFIDYRENDASNFVRDIDLIINRVGGMSRLGSKLPITKFWDDRLNDELQMASLCGGTVYWSTASVSTTSSGSGDIPERISSAYHHIASRGMRARRRGSISVKMNRRL